MPPVNSVASANPVARAVPGMGVTTRTETKVVSLFKTTKRDSASAAAKLITSNLNRVKNLISANDEHDHAQGTGEQISKHLFSSRHKSSLRRWARDNFWGANVDARLSERSNGAKLRTAPKLESFNLGLDIPTAFDIAEEQARQEVGEAAWEAASQQKKDHLSKKAFERFEAACGGQIAIHHIVEYVAQARVNAVLKEAEESTKKSIVQQQIKQLNKLIDSGNVRSITVGEIARAQAARAYDNAPQNKTAKRNFKNLSAYEQELLIRPHRAAFYAQSDRIKAEVVINWHKEIFIPSVKESLWERVETVLKKRCLAGHDIDWNEYKNICEAHHTLHTHPSFGLDIGAYTKACKDSFEALAKGKSGVDWEAYEAGCKKIEKSCTKNGKFDAEKYKDRCQSLLKRSTTYGKELHRLRKKYEGRINAQIAFMQILRRSATVAGFTTKFLVAINNRAEDLVGRLFHCINRCTGSFLPSSLVDDLAKGVANSGYALMIAFLAPLTIAVAGIGLLPSLFAVAAALTAAGLGATYIGMNQFGISGSIQALAVELAEGAGEADNGGKKRVQDNILLDVYQRFCNGLHAQQAARLFQYEDIVHTHLRVDRLLDVEQFDARRNAITSAHLTPGRKQMAEHNARLLNREIKTCLNELKFLRAPDADPAILKAARKFYRDDPEMSAVLLDNTNPEERTRVCNERIKQVLTTKLRFSTPAQAQENGEILPAEEGSGFNLIQAMELMKYSADEKYLVEQLIKAHCPGIHRRYQAFLDDKLQQLAAAGLNFKACTDRQALRNTLLEIQKIRSARERQDIINLLQEIDYLLPDGAKSAAFSGFNRVNTNICLEGISEMSLQDKLNSRALRSVHQALTTRPIENGKFKNLSEKERLESQLSAVFAEQLSDGAGGSTKKIAELEDFYTTIKSFYHSHKHSILPLEGRERTITFPVPGPEGGRIDIALPIEEAMSRIKIIYETLGKALAFCPNAIMPNNLAETDASLFAVNHKKRAKQVAQVANHVSNDFWSVSIVADNTIDIGKKQFENAYLLVDKLGRSAGNRPDAHAKLQDPYMPAAAGAAFSWAISARVPPVEIIPGDKTGVFDINLRPTLVNGATKLVSTGFSFITCAALKFASSADLDHANSGQFIKQIGKAKEFDNALESRRFFGKKNNQERVFFSSAFADNYRDDIYGDENRAYSTHFV
ncbi:MAG: hypothetical protein ACK5NY_00975 [Burkholderiaceae bacterium]